MYMQAMASGRVREAVMTLSKTEPPVHVLNFGDNNFIVSVDISNSRGGGGD